MIRVGFLVAGIKGFRFLSDLLPFCDAAFISSYPVKGTRDDAFAAITGVCSENKLLFVKRSNLVPEVFNRAELIFVVGWQYLLPEIDERFIIFHDSLLPRYRGFAPTVTALINGERAIGVTALSPSAQVDQGPIYAQKSVAIDYPIRIKEALVFIGDCYFQAAQEILVRYSNKILVATPQDESAATYSLWRDEEDYFIDWSWPADKVQRFVDAVGWPYDGAKSIYRGKMIMIDAVEAGEPLGFEDCHPGKFWSVKNKIPQVVCGQGTIRIVSARYSDGRRVDFDKLRERLVCPCRDNRLDSSVIEVMSPPAYNSSEEKKSFEA